MILWLSRFLPLNETILSIVCMLKLWERKCLCWVIAPLSTNICSPTHTYTHTHTHTHTHTLGMWLFPSLRTFFSSEWLRPTLTICYILYSFITNLNLHCAFLPKRANSLLKHSYSITTCNYHSTHFSGQHFRFSFFICKYYYTKFKSIPFTNTDWSYLMLPTVSIPRPKEPPVLVLTL